MRQIRFGGMMEFRTGLKNTKTLTTLLSLVYKTKNPATFRDVRGSGPKLAKEF